MKRLRKSWSSNSSDAPKNDDRTDSFSSVWGGTTQLKYSVARGQRFRAGTAIPDPMFTHTMLAMPRPPVSVPSSSTRRGYPDLNKPLPPLPPEAGHTSVPESDSHRAMISDSQAAPVPPQASALGLGPPINGVYDSSARPRAIRRKPAFGFSLKKQPPKQPDKPAVVHVLAPARPLMVDHGTQTSPSLEFPPARPPIACTKSAQTHSSAESTQTMVPHAQNATEASSDEAATKMPSASPPWSPRESSDPGYFTFSDKATRNRGAKHKSAGRGLKVQEVKTPPSPKRKSPTDSTLDTLATYESRYSPRPRDTELEPARSPLARNASSDDSVIVTPKGSQNNVDDAAVNDASIETPTRSTPAGQAPSFHLPLPMPFNRLPSFSPTTPAGRRASMQKQSLRRSSEKGSGEKTPSPLRNGMSLLRTPPSTRQHDSAPSTYFRMPIFSDPLSPYEPAPVMAMNLPEHFGGSPLCPLHPRNKGYGVLTCPAHGPPKFLLETGSDDSTKSSPGSHSPDEGASSDEGGRKAPLARRDFWEMPEGAERGSPADRREFWEGVEEEAEVERATFRLRSEEHGEDSLLCPAHPRNAGGKGVCVYHGRATRPGAGGKDKDRSDDSVPRVRLNV